MPTPSAIGVIAPPETGSTAMSWPPTRPALALPDELSDETVAALLELLYDLARELERHYAGQLHRYYHPEDTRQQALWPDDDPPF